MGQQVIMYFSGFPEHLYWHKEGRYHPQRGCRISERKRKARDNLSHEAFTSLHHNRGPEGRAVEGRFPGTSSKDRNGAHGPEEGHDADNAEADSCDGERFDTKVKHFTPTFQCRAKCRGQPHWDHHFNQPSDKSFPLRSTPQELEEGESFQARHLQAFVRAPSRGHA